LFFVDAFVCSLRFYRLIFIELFTVISRLEQYVIPMLCLIPGMHFLHVGMRMASELKNSEKLKSLYGSPPLGPWSSASEAIPLDFAGPVDIIFDRFEDAWTELPINERFEQIALRHAERIAVDDGTTRLTYRALRRAAYNLALRIETLTPPGRPVGILLPHNALFPLAALACLAIGRPYVPIDLKYPVARIHDVLREAGAAAVILDASADTEQIVPAALPQIDIGSAATAADEPAMPFGSDVSVDDPAVILYTSGSTGKPKGICNSQRAILQRVAESTNSCHVHADDRFILLSSPGTIAGVRETFAALLNGATLHATDPHERGVHDVLKMLREGRITICYTVPALLRTLLRAPGAKEAFAHMRIMRVGGDITLESDFALCRSIVPASCHFFASFSSTEMPAAFQWFVPLGWQADGLRVPVGYARPGVSFLAVGDDGLPVAPGEAGELIVRSRYLALGQWQDGRLQAGAFLPDPNDPSMRILRTGDLVKLRADGLWELIGRKDRQIKIRGQRIDPGEVEAALRSCADVSDAAVIARRDGEEVVALVAYVVPRATADAGLADALKSVLDARVPRHMHPADIRLLDAIPQLPGFKPDVGALARLDRIALALRAPALQSDEAETADKDAEAGRSHCPDARIRDAVKYGWTTVLGSRSFQANQRWDHTGGDSLKAMELWFHIEQRLGQKIALDALDGSTTPGSLTATIERYFDLPAGRRVEGMNTDGTPVIFLMPGIAGDEPLLVQFRATFGKNLRFKVIDYPDWRQTMKDSVSFEEIVDAAYAQIFAEPACERYDFMGYSFGGFVAHETARRLAASGRHVGFLGLLDSRRGSMAQSSQLKRYRSLLAKPGRMPAALLRTSMAVLLHKRWFTLLRAVTRIVMSRPTTLAFNYHNHLIERLRLDALERWRPTRFDVSATLFLSDDRTPDAPADYGWSNLCKSVAMVHIGGTHYTMMDFPRRELLAALLIDALKAAAPSSADHTTNPLLFPGQQVSKELLNSALR
jgi:amino acid adenylation domain-containing protein